VRREVWFEDVRSFSARLRLVSEYGLAGVSIWTVNQLYRPGLLALHSLYSAEKIL
jgi:spore germination protein